MHQGHTLVPAGGDRFQDEDILSDEGGQSSEEDDEDFQGQWLDLSRPHISLRPCIVEHLSFSLLPTCSDDLLSDDMLSGEDDEILEQQRQQVSALNTRQRSSRQEEDGEEFEEGEDDAIGARLHEMTSDERDLDDQDDELAPSAHAQRQQRMQDKIRLVCRNAMYNVMVWHRHLADATATGMDSLDRKLEDAAIGDKAWFMQGEVDAGEISARVFASVPYS